MNVFKQNSFEKCDKTEVNIYDWRRAQPSAALFIKRTFYHFFYTWLGAALKARHATRRF